MREILALLLWIPFVLIYVIVILFIVMVMAAAEKSLKLMGRKPSADIYIPR